MIPSLLPYYPYASSVPLLTEALSEPIFSSVSLPPYNHHDDLSKTGTRLLSLESLSPTVVILKLG